MESIAPEDKLYRRIFRYWLVDEEQRVSSSAFKDRKGKPDPELSVYLARIESAERVLQFGVPGQGVVSLPAHVPLSLRLSVRHDPQPESYGHCLIVGASSARQCSALADACTMEIPPSTR